MQTAGLKRVVGIACAHEVEPIGGADRATSGAVAGLKRGGDVIGGPCACPDPFQRADKAAHLIVQE